jgi:polyhydroxyalkanoate synthesis regulator phasin
MANPLRNLLYGGIGFAVNSAHAFRRAVNEVSEQSRHNVVDGQAFLNELWGRTNQPRRRASRFVGGEFRRLMDRVGFAPESEVEELRKRVRELERELREGHGHRGPKDSPGEDAGDETRRKDAGSGGSRSTASGRKGGSKQ